VKGERDRGKEHVKRKEEFLISQHKKGMNMFPKTSKEKGLKKTWVGG